MSPGRRPEGARSRAPIPRPGLSAAVRGLRSRLTVAGALLAAALVAWALLGQVVSPLASAAVGACATTALLTSIWLLLGRAVRSAAVPAGWVAGGYLLRLLIVAAALVGGRAAGLDTRLIGAGLIAAVVVGTALETWVLARAGVPTVDPGPDDDPSAVPDEPAGRLD